MVGAQRFYVVLFGRHAYVVGRSGITRHRNHDSAVHFGLSRATLGGSEAAPAPAARREG